MDARQDTTVESLVEEMQRKFPEQSPEQICAVVLQHWGHFAGAKVRDSVPMLVRLRAISQLHAAD